MTGGGNYMNVEDKRAKLRLYGAYKKEHDRLHMELINHMKETNNRAYINSPKYRTLQNLTLFCGKLWYKY